MIKNFPFVFRVKFGLILCIFFRSAVATLCAAVPQDTVVDLKATVSDAAPYITLSWTQRVQSNITAQALHRRIKDETTWVKLADLSTTQTSYADSSAVAGVEYEYWMQRSLSISPNTAMGYLSAGVKVPELHSRGKLLLVIDATMAAPLAPEIDLLKQDLAGEGWTVVSIIAPRTGTATATKTLIKTAYDADPLNVKLVYILGHVPVPYSGLMFPDGHPDHYGAWPADGYYGDVDGVWTDTSINNVAAGATRNQNIPGDGKFDQTTFPSLVELQVGRVDMYRLGRSPSAIDATIETTLLRRYLNKAHNFRHKLGAYASIPRHSLIRDGFGFNNSTEPFAITGWAGAFVSVGQTFSPAFDEAPFNEWFSPSFAGGQNYLWGNACGGGSWESISGFGSSTDLGHKASRVVFMSVFGSYHGDWDCDNNVMRSILAGNPNGDSLGLCCFWSGRPNWFVHSLGLGGTLGGMTRASMNAALTGGGGYVPTGTDYGKVHLGLMGDPALRIHSVEPPRNLGGTSASGLVTLSWSASTESALQGYHVYRAATPLGPFTKLTVSPQSGTSFTDTTATTGNSYTYQVRTLKLESAPGGSYYNLSVGSPVTLMVGNAATATPRNPSELTIVSQPSAGSALISWRDNSIDESGFRIERKVNAAGAWIPLAALGANANGYNDVGPFSHGNVYYYRVVATSGAGDSVASNIASFEASAGFLEFSVRSIKVNKNAGAASMVVTRFGGGTGAVTVNYATDNSTATEGVHFANTTGGVSWADGETGGKTITVPIINTATAQQARQFYLNLVAPSVGARLGVFSRVAVLIEDPTATLSSPWSQTLLGSVTHSSPAVDAEGSIGSTMTGGNLAGGSYGEEGRFIYQARAGDGSMSAYIPATTPASWGAKMALMVRASLSPNAVTAGVATSAAGWVGGFGTKSFYRLSTVIVENTIEGGNHVFVTPCWIRLTRMGTIFKAEHSTNGSSWTALGQVDTGSMPDTAYWGLFNCAVDVNTTDYSSEYQLSRFENISFANLPAPVAPSSLEITTDNIANNLVLTWASSANSAGYRIERRREDGSFEQIANVSPSSLATLSYTDSGLTLDTPYKYRVTAYNSTGSATSAEMMGSTAPADITIVRTTDDVGGADATLRADSPDGVFGAQSLLTTAGRDPLTNDLNAVAKSYLRFNLSGLPGPIKTTKLKLAFNTHRLFAEAGYFLLYAYLLNSEVADVWDEFSISWNNAPLNQTSGTSLLSPTLYFGNYYVGNVAQFPGAGIQANIPIGGLTPSTIGANNLITLALIVTNQGAQVDWASREHATYAPPTLEMTFANLQPRRPGFLAIEQGSGSARLLTWADGSLDETGFQIERRVANGQWSLLTTAPANTTNFTDSTALPGVLYEYRIRAATAADNSSWATLVSLLHASVATVNHPVWSPDGVQLNQWTESPGNGYVPNGLMYYPVASSFVGTPAVGTLTRNNFGGWLGMKITVGATPLTLRELGRWVIAGNTGIHIVKIVDAATSADVPGGAVSVATAGTPAGMRYAALPAPVTLAANKSYLIVSQETSGGDSWYEAGAVQTYNSSIATINNAIYSSSPTTYADAYSANQCYVPVGFKYSIGTEAFLTGHSMTVLRNDLTGWMGAEITVGASPMFVSQLGRWVAPGNSGTHTVKLVNAGTGAEIASASIATAGTTSGQFKYTSLASPVTLAANTSYYLLSQEIAGGDQWYDFSTAAAGTATGYQQWLLANGLPMDASGEGSATATPASDGLPNLIKYALGLTSTVSGNDGHLSYGSVNDSGADYLTFIYTRPTPAPTDITYVVETSGDLAAWSSFGLVQVGSTMNAGLQTLTIRDSVPISSSTKRFMRLKITQP